MNAPTGDFNAQATELARIFMGLWMPSRIVCPSESAEIAVLEAFAVGAQANAVPVEVIDLRSEPAERLAALTARLADWNSGPTHNPQATPTLLILQGFDVFGDKRHEEPTYPFRSKFQFDEFFRWVFVGRDPERMDFLFNSYDRPLYRAAIDITPAA